MAARTGCIIPRKIVYMFRFFTIFILLCTSISRLIASQEDATEPVPTAYFHAVIFEGGGAIDLSFAPWDNFLEENATSFTIKIGSYRISQKFCYYGSSPIRFYDQSNSLVLEYHFKSSSSSVPEVLLLIQKSADKSLKAYGLPFDMNRIPMGHYLFQSFAKEPTFFKVDKEKFAIKPRTSRLFMPNNNSKNCLINGYLQRADKYQDALVALLPKHRAKRGILSLKVSEDRIILQQFTTQSVDLQSVVGYGSTPRLERILPEEDGNETKPPNFTDN